MSNHYMEMLGLWLELDLNGEDWKSILDSVKYWTKVENERLFDDHTRICLVYLLKDKTKVQNCLSIFTLIKTQFQTKIQVLRIDNGIEYVNHSLKDYLQTYGIIHQISCVYTS